MRKRTWVPGVVALAFVVAATLRGVTRRFVIRESSMRPTLEPDDWVIARRRTDGLRRGDVVVFADPTGSGIDLVKRVIGLPGERVGIDGGRVTIGDALLADRWAHGSTRPDGSWELGPDEVWLLGDNRAHSVSDGRVLGGTPLDEIDWVVVARYWPTSRIAKL